MGHAGDMPPLWWMTPKSSARMRNMRRAVDFRLSAYKVGLLWVQVLAIFIQPGFLGVIAVIEENGGGVPVQFFLRHERTALQDENILAGLSQVESKRSTAGAGSDNDCVVLSRHNG